jgi:hypothetical protein
MSSNGMVEIKSAHDAGGKTSWLPAGSLQGCWAMLERNKICMWLDEYEVLIWLEYAQTYH